MVTPQTKLLFVIVVCLYQIQDLIVAVRGAADEAALARALGSIEMT
jgi:hypothetical protein